MLLCCSQADTANYATQKAACKALKGDLVSYNTGGPRGGGGGGSMLHRKCATARADVVSHAEKRLPSLS
jgi:hypothetical protein